MHIRYNETTNLWEVSDDPTDPEATFSKLDLSGDFPDFASYTPTWSTSGSAPSLGDGTLAGRWVRRGKFVWFSLQLTFGSTTSAGTGTQRFTTPSTFANNPLFNGLAIDASPTAFYPAIGSPSAGGTIALIGTAAGAVFTETVPITWANGDIIRITGTYEEA
jgi:hypothetical protein